MGILGISTRLNEIVINIVAISKCLVNFIYLLFSSGSILIFINNIINVTPAIPIPIFLNIPINSCKVSIFYLLLLQFGINALIDLAVFPILFIRLPFGLIINFPSIIGVFTDTIAIAIP